MFVMYIWTLVYIIYLELAINKQNSHINVLKIEFIKRLMYLNKFKNI